MTDRPKIAIVAPNAWPIFAPQTGGPFGGAEVRAALFARGLARRGALDVSMTMADYDQPEVVDQEGIRFFRRTGEKPPTLEGPVAPPKWWHRSQLARYQRGPIREKALWAGLAVAHLVGRPVRTAQLRYAQRRDVAGWIGEFGVPRAPFELYEKIDADVYTALPGGTHLSVELAYFARKRRRRFVFFGASDGDFSPDFKLRPKEAGVFGMAGYLHIYALENADEVIVQTEAQAELLEKHFGRRASLILRNPIDLQPAFSRVENPSMVLWVGKSSWIKQPAMIFELARRLPGTRFVVVLNPVEAPLHRKMLAEAESVKNVELLEYVEYLSVERLFAEAALLVNTSSFEGFPNTFLQAAKYGVPTVSLAVDPDGMLARHGAGLCCGSDFERLTREVRELLADTARREFIGGRARAYLEEHHDREKIVEKFERFMETTAGHK